MSLLEDSVLQQSTPSYQVTKFSNVQIRSNKLVVTNEYLNKPYSKNVREESIKNLDKKGTVSHIKKGAVARIDKMLTNWIKSMYYENEVLETTALPISNRPVFITLTLPAQQIHPDTAIKRNILMPFIQDLKRKCGVVYYFWKAELQQNYNIHFHMVVDSYIDKRRLQSIWNHHCETLGYVGRFQIKHGHTEPPSTHIESIRNLRMMTSYVTKYVCKNEYGGWIDGQLWNASGELKAMKTVSFHMDTYLMHVIDELLQEQKMELYENEHFAIISFTKKFDHGKDYGYFRDLEKCAYMSLYDELYNPKPSMPRDIAPVDDQYMSEPTQLSMELDIDSRLELMDYR